MSRDMTKPTKWLCAQRRLRSAWASAQSDQSSLCAQLVAKDPSFLHADSGDLIRLGGCSVWSESSLGAQSFCWFCHVATQLFITIQTMWMGSDYHRIISAFSENPLYVYIKKEIDFCFLWIYHFPFSVPWVHEVNNHMSLYWTMAFCTEAQENQRNDLCALRE